MEENTTTKTKIYAVIETVILIGFSVLLMMWLFSHLDQKYSLIPKAYASTDWTVTADTRLLYHLEDNTGTNGTGTTLTAYNSPTYVAAHFNNGLQADDAGNKFLCGNVDPAYQHTNDASTTNVFTFKVINNPSIGQSRGIWDYSKNGTAYASIKNDGGTMKLILNDGKAGNVDQSYTINLSDGNFHNLVMTYNRDNGDARGYLDGSLVLSWNNAGASQNTAEQLVLGSYANAGCTDIGYTGDVIVDEYFHIEGAWTQTDVDYYFNNFYNDVITVPTITEWIYPNENEASNTIQFSPWIVNTSGLNSSTNYYVSVHSYVPSVTKIFVDKSPVFYGSSGGEVPIERNYQQVANELSALGYEEFGALLNFRATAYLYESGSNKFVSQKTINFGLSYGGTSDLGYPPDTIFIPVPNESPIGYSSSTESGIYSRAENLNSTSTPCVPAADWTDIGGGARYASCWTLNVLFLGSHQDAALAFQDSWNGFKQTFPFGVPFEVYDELSTAVSSTASATTTLQIAAHLPYSIYPVATSSRTIVIYSVASADVLWSLAEDPVQAKADWFQVTRYVTVIIFLLVIYFTIRPEHKPVPASSESEAIRLHKNFKKVMSRNENKFSK